MGQQFLFVYCSCLCLVFPDYDVVLPADERLEKWSRDLGAAQWLHCVCQQDATNARNTDLSFRQLLVKGKVRGMRKVDK